MVIVCRLIRKWVSHLIRKIIFYLTPNFVNYCRLLCLWLWAFFRTQILHSCLDVRDYLSLSWRFQMKQGLTFSRQPLLVKAWMYSWLLEGYLSSRIADIPDSSKFCCSSGCKVHIDNMLVESRTSKSPTFVSKILSGLD